MLGVVIINNSKSLMLLISLLILITIASISKIDRGKEMQESRIEIETTKEIELQKNKKRSLETEVFRIKNEEKLARLEEEKQVTMKKTNLVASAETPTRGGSREFMATAYDLSVESCGKKPSHPAYGITASGVSLKGKSLEDKYIAVDPKVIKLGSQVHIQFFDEYEYLSGDYTAVDTGGVIKGKKVDIFFGSGNVSEQVKNFGIRKVRISH